ncbi:hypothetical protein P7D85_13745 [Enterococcus hulanensis]|uniref:Lipoprotein n=1 Tax=Enterococcus hulanensis TaxID=2559929 RepID=A0ABU3F133_9ENTE|nr:hypothetical protein [Enterococcus hulanensis]MDT2600844.1 hypothetical protein [Enterococcus hulanensis]MDT2611935.1 hypothetical protein [Enterococcus hulanensis]MDT2618083.1 hypothetical protein [Enterococcus hulanensis]MDT2629086.1 hypothetical protein [Enterococcus hulanensis]MDT2656648.1 hypothetical protein [Enterococcus hulanensis]
MKKFKVIMVIALALVVFTGCKKQTQKEFSEELAKQSEMNSGEFSAVIDKLTIETEDSDAPTRTMTDMAAKLISGTKVSGNYLIDFKKELLATNMTVDNLGQKLPIELYIDGKRPSTYMSTAFMSELVDIVKEFNPDIPFDAEMFEEVEGKYILDDQKESKEKDDAKTDVGTLSESLNSDLVSDYLGTLDPDSFEKKEDTIKRTFTKKDIQNFIKYAKENGDKDAKKEVKELEKNIDDLTEYKQTVTLNTKKHTQKSTMKLTVKSEDTTSTIDLTMNNKPKDSDKKIKLPKKADTISMEEFEKIIEDAQENTSLISEEDFNELLSVIRSNGSQLSQAQIEEFKSTYKPYLTDEQYKQLEEALDQAGQITA